MSRERVFPLFDRELSWLSFNHRVLQEAMDPGVPLLNRLEFLAIYSSNLDEFFRVRVASLRSLMRLKSRSRKDLELDPEWLLGAIHETVVEQQTLFGAVFRRRVLPELEARGIFLREEAGDDTRTRDYLDRYFREHVRPRVRPLVLEETDKAPFLQDRRVYLIAELWSSRSDREALGTPAYGVVEVPCPDLPRFVVLPAPPGEQHVMFLDDVLRHSLPELFPGFEIGAAHAVKLSRDAELYLEDEFDVDVVEAVRRSVKKRETGLPCRFLYDFSAPPAMVAQLQRSLRLESEDLVQGGRYHNLHDLASFPCQPGAGLSAEPLPPLERRELEAAPTLFSAISERDHVLHFPYHSYGYVIRFLEEAANDPDVESVWITLYRVAGDSAVVRALMRAAERGKRVHAFVEVKARFDEEANLGWAERMEAAGVRTIYSLPGLKVHAKLLLVVRREAAGRRRYAYLATGNFNEKTARVYADHGLFTADERLTGDVREVFRYLRGRVAEPACDHLLVAPFTLRSGLEALIRRQVRRARRDLPAGITLKMNSLEDSRMIAGLYRASQAGVDVRLVVRGICCLVPGLDGVSERIEARSIVDRYLEHARIFAFGPPDQPDCYLASADWMRRNLDHRVEVAFPLYDEHVRREVLDLLALQQADSTKARVIDATQQNTYVAAAAGHARRAQTDTYALLRRRAERSRESDRIVVSA